MMSSAQDDSAHMGHFGLILYTGMKCRHVMHLFFYANESANIHLATTGLFVMECCADICGSKRDKS